MAICAQIHFPAVLDFSPVHFSSPCFEREEMIKMMMGWYLSILVFLAPPSVDKQHCAHPRVCVSVLQCEGKISVEGNEVDE